MLTILIFIIILGILVFVHELGHFLVAKKNGVKVEEFGLGFPPRIYSIKKGETIYSLNVIPLGGFVKIFGEDGEEKKHKRSFGSKKIWRRMSILIAGVSMNVVLAFILLSVGFGIGLPTAISDEENIANSKVQITEVMLNSPAKKAGIKTGDAIIEINGAEGNLRDIQKVAAVQEFIAQNKEKEIIISLERGRKVFSVNALPRENPPSGEGALGIGMARVAKISYPWYKAIYEGFISTLNLIWMTLSSFGYLIFQIFQRGNLVGEVTGPVGIYSVTGQAAQMGFIYLLQLTALLSINLAMINILPFPALDGGRILFLAIEKIKGSPVSQNIEKAIHSAGFAFLILLMVLITVKDVMKMF